MVAIGLVVAVTVASFVAADAFGAGLMRGGAVARLAPRSTTARGMLSMRWGLKGNTANKITGDLPDAGFLLTASSFFGYVMNQDGGGDAALSSLGFVYGIPVFLIGLSLWYAEIPPVVVVSDAAGDRAWEAHGTDTLQKIKKDVTRHRYGDDAHLDSSLDALGLKLPQKKFPKMQTIVQEATADGQLVFTMVFESLETPYKVWAEPERVERYTRFFGPGVRAEVVKVDAAKRLVGIKLTSGDFPATDAAAAPAAPVSEPVASVAAAGDDGF